MNWNLEGLRVTGKYVGVFEVTGKVNLSRVKYGGGVSHHVVLDEPVEVYGALRDSVVLNHEDVEFVKSGN